MNNQQKQFLIELGNKLNTQDNLGTADPYYFVIQDWESKHRTYINTEYIFLTKDAADLCLKQNSHHFHQKAKVYCKYAGIRNWEMEELIKSLKSIKVEDFINVE